jgi:3-(3-hydroxy-phenyl)propionate hydroxylase
MGRGGVIPQFRVQTPEGHVRPSDDVLGPTLALVGFGAGGADALARLDTATRLRWAEFGGATVSVVPPEQRERAANNAHVILDGAISPEVLRRGWCAVVRPDRTVLHDGPSTELASIVRDAIRVLTAP